jgi:hypothetical protein
VAPTSVFSFTANAVLNKTCAINLDFRTPTGPLTANVDGKVTMHRQHNLPDRAR